MAEKKSAETSSSVRFVGDPNRQDLNVLFSKSLRHQKPVDKQKHQREAGVPVYPRVRRINQQDVL